MYYQPRRATAPASPAGAVGTGSLHQRGLHPDPRVRLMSGDPLSAFFIESNIDNQTMASTA